MKSWVGVRDAECGAAGVGIFAFPGAIAPHFAGNIQKSTL
jgi:hypothetical protein